MKKVLILTAGFGEGHNAAARNVREALESASDDFKVEILDLLEISYGRLNQLVRTTYAKVIDYAPSVWNGIYEWLDGARWPHPDGAVGLFRLREHLSDILKSTEPDCVITTYPLYAPLIQLLYQDHSERPFRLISVVTDSITAHSMWWRSPCDYWVVSNDATAEVLRAGGVPADRVKALGFPVSPRFAELSTRFLESPDTAAVRRLLLVVNHNKKKAVRTVEELLELPRVHLTVTVGRDAELKADLAEATKHHSDRVTLLGWTNIMPRLLVESHLLITKAGGAIIQEALAARCPMIINHVIPGQEEGNARLVTESGYGAVAERRKHVAGLVEETFAHRGMRWHQWRKNLERDSKPDGAIRLAELVNKVCHENDEERQRQPLFGPKRQAVASMELSTEPDPDFIETRRATPRAREHPPLLCDLHTHTTYSDGVLSVSELVDFYGRRGFDCLCITDHLADPRRVLGKLVRLTNLVLSPNQLDEYFEVIARERRRAWHKYSMLLLTGIEFNKDGLTPKSSAHLLGIDLQSPINPGLDLEATITEIHRQSGLAIASHPHVMKTEWGKNTLYLWENQDKYASMIDAWEIANRNNIFSPVSLKRLPFLANSDFHKPKHIESWKSILRCEKHPDAIKACIRDNRNVSITLYRDEAVGEAEANGIGLPEAAVAEAAAAGRTLIAARV